MCGVPPLSGLVWVAVGCVRVVNALSLFFFCGFFCVVTLWNLGVPPLSGIFVDFGSLFVRGPLLVCWRRRVVLMDGGAFGWLLSVVWGSLGRRLGFSGTTIRGAACTCGVVCRRLRGFGLGRR